MGKKRKCGCNDVCLVCGAWAELTCDYCGRQVCDRHARAWPLPRPGEKWPSDAPPSRTIITCPRSKCQAKLPPEAKDAARKQLQLVDAT